MVSSADFYLANSVISKTNTKIPNPVQQKALPVDVLQELAKQQANKTKNSISFLLPCLLVLWSLKHKSNKPSSCN